MLIRNTSDRFGWVAKLLHWVAAVLMIGLTWLGWYMVDLGYYDPWSQDSLIVHKSLGMIVLALALVKVLWLWNSPTPAPLSTLKGWEIKSSKLVHWILFLAMFVIPVTGYLVSTSEGAPVPVFDWFDVPALFNAGASARDLAIDIHFYTAYVILGWVALHAGAALKHHFITKDETLKRML